MNDLSQKHVVITGASRGIGEAAARHFASLGAKVSLLARSKERISSIASEIGGSAQPIPCDVSSFDSVQTAITAAENHFGDVDILINNAGTIEPISHLASADPDAWSQAIDVNLKGVFYGIRVVLPGMIARKTGTIITVSSGAAHNPIEAWGHYCAAKAGAAMMTRMLDLENRQTGIRAMGLSPGTVATQMQKEIKASGINPISQLEWSDHIPPEWPARTLAWMCSSASDAFLGQEILLRDPEIREAVGLI